MPSQTRLVAPNVYTGFLWHYILYQSSQAAFKPQVQYLRLADIYPTVLQTQDLPLAKNLFSYIPPTTTLGASTLTEYQNCGINYQL